VNITAGIMTITRRRVILLLVVSGRPDGVTNPVAGLMTITRLFVRIRQILMIVSGNRISMEASVRCLVAGVSMITPVSV